LSSLVAADLTHSSFCGVGIAFAPRLHTSRGNFGMVWVRDRDIAAARNQ
jgi:hypothetical protein